MKVLLLFILSLFLTFLSPRTTLAIYDPASVPNNIYGIHILFPDEVFEARDLVNSNGGDWGYVTIPIQSSDRDIEKWQIFMDDARDLNLIPILRLATDGDYFNTKVWEKPTPEKILDFANFLNSLEWPTQNRYVVVFNEVNRNNEWGGAVSPSEYAEILNYAIDTFKSRSSDFFIISAGLDNAAANSEDSMNEYDYILQMEDAVPGIFAKLDGFASHSYPNPGFSQNPSINTTQSIYSFAYEINLANELAGKSLPIFITETGWSSDKISQETIARYFERAFQTAWSDKNIVAVTPFLLRAEQGDFSQFSFIVNGARTEKYNAIKNLPKVKGEPVLTPVSKQNPLRKVTLPIRRFFYNLETNPLFKAIEPTKQIFKWLLNL